MKSNTSKIALLLFTLPTILMAAPATETNLIEKKAFDLNFLVLNSQYSEAPLEATIPIGSRSGFGLEAIARLDTAGPVPFFRVAGKTILVSNAVEVEKSSQSTLGAADGKEDYFQFQISLAGGWDVMKTGSNFQISPMLGLQTLQMTSDSYGVAGLNAYPTAGADFTYYLGYNTDIRAHAHLGSTLLQTLFTDGLNIFAYDLNMTLGTPIFFESPTRIGFSMERWSARSTSAPNAPIFKSMGLILGQNF